MYWLYDDGKNKVDYEPQELTEDLEKDPEKDPEKDSRSDKRLKYWEFKAKNALMFSPESFVSENILNPRSKQKQVVYENTKFSYDEIEKSLTNQPLLESADYASSDYQSSFRGYSLIDSPLYTGSIDGPSERPSAKYNSQSSSVIKHKPRGFSILESPFRETLAHKLASKSKKKLNPPGSKTSNPETPGSSARLLSPAGQRLLFNSSKKPK